MDVHGYMPQHGAYVVTDGSGRVLAGARTLKAARQKRTALAARNPLVATHIVKMR